MAIASISVIQGDVSTPGQRTGVSVGCVKLHPEKTWNPFSARFKRIIIDNNPGSGRRAAWYGYRTYGS